MRDGFIKVAAGVPHIRVAHPAHNAGQIIALIRQAAEQGVKVLCLPELCLTGATCGDLFFQSALLDGAEEGLEAVLEASKTMDMLITVGMPVRGQWDGTLYNCAAVLHRGTIKGLIPKVHLSEGEGRWFSSGAGLDTGVTLCAQHADISVRGSFGCSTLPELVVAVEIGEDLWAPQPPSTEQACHGATLILNPAASPALAGQAQYRRALVAGQSARLLCGYVSAGAGEGESTAHHVYGGHCLVAEGGRLLADERFGTGLVITELDVEGLAHGRRRNPLFAPTKAPEDFWRASFPLEWTDTILTRPVSSTPFIPHDPARLDERCREVLTVAALGLKQRLAHTGAKAAVIGLSGGLDSTLAALITARALDMLGRPRSHMVALTMPCFGTTQRTRGNAERLAEELGAELRVVDISAAVTQHFADIGQDMGCHDVTFENAQARERTQVLMDVANQTGGLVVGTGDLSELALGWCTYNGDHMSMYAVNGSIPKTLMRHLVAHEARRAEGALAAVLGDILDTPVSPELLPPKEGEIAQKTEELVGPYELHDFFLYHAVRRGCPPRKVLRLAERAFGGRYDRAVVLHWLKRFYSRFFSQQFKRSCLPDGPAVGALSLAGEGWRMPSDACAALWQQQLEGL